MLKHTGLVLLFSAATAFCGYGQSVKKKLLGTYSGTIPSYTIESGEQLIRVEATSLNIVFLSENKVEETIGAAKTEGTYRITSEDKTVYTIQVNYPNQVVYEELVLSKKDKTILRKGFYPQPEGKLAKI